MLALIGLFLWLATFMTFVTNRNNQTRAKLKSIENKQKHVMHELLEIKRIVYGEARKTKEAEAPES